MGWYMERCCCCCCCCWAAGTLPPPEGDTEPPLCCCCCCCHCCCFICSYKSIEEHLRNFKITKANLTHQTDTLYQIILPSTQPDHHTSQLKLLQRNSSGVHISQYWENHIFTINHSILSPPQLLKDEMLLDRPSKIPN